MKLRSLLTASAVVTLATVVVILMSYAMVAVRARVLGAERYGELVVLLGLSLGRVAQDSLGGV